MDIVLAGGTYPGGVAVRGEGNRGRLTIRARQNAAGHYETVILDGGRDVGTAAPVAGRPGLHRFTLPRVVFGREPQVWEADTKVRYRLVADRLAAETFPGSFWFEAPAGEGAADVVGVLHTSDGRPAAAHRIRVSEHASGLLVQRPDVTIRGLEFRDFLSWRYSAGIVSRAPRTSIEDVTVRNAVRAFDLGAAAHGSVVRSCVALDVGAGVYVSGANDVTVDGCRIERASGPFAIPLFPQDEAGIQFYHPSLRGTVQNNLVIGFRHGLFIKSQDSPFRVEWNSFVEPSGSGERGMGPNRWNRESAYVGNLVAGYSRPVEMSSPVPAEMTARWNCFEPPANQRIRAALARFGNVAWPDFIDPDAGDFRLSAASPCQTGGPEGRVAGALAAAPRQEAVRGPWRARLALAPPARFSDLPDDAKEASGRPRDAATGLWLTPNRTLRLQIESDAGLDRARAMRLRIGQEAWGPPVPVVPELDFELPPDTTTAQVGLALQDAQGDWRELPSVLVELASTGPRLLDEPRIIATEHGALIRFSTDRPAQAILHYGPAEPLGTVTRADPRSQRWLARAADGVEIAQTLTLLPANRQQEEPLHWRLELRDALGRAGDTRQGVLRLSGEARTLYVSPGGLDAQGGDTEGAPLRTLQAAVDQALPGDRILLEPGLYAGATVMTRGGTPGAPITIASRKPGTVVFDGFRNVGTPLRLLEAPHVRIEGIEIRWFEHAGIELTKSAHVELRQLEIWNDFWFGWVGGDGIRALRSPGLVVEDCVVYRTETALWLRESPNARIEGNTAAGNTFASLWLLRSAAGTVVQHNSFTFEGLQPLRITAEQPGDLATFRSDYNNLATFFRKPLAREPALSQDERGRVQPAERVLRRAAAKFLVGLEGKVTRADLPGASDRIYRAANGSLRFFSLEEWREASGQDQHSLFADPLYVDAERGDFRLRAASPNIGAGREGRRIGALGAVSGE